MLSIAKDQNIKDSDNCKSNENSKNNSNYGSSSNVCTDLKIIEIDDKSLQNPSATAENADNSNNDKNTDDNNNNLMIKSTAAVSGTELTTNSKNSTDDENFLFQLQVLFGYLRLSEKRFYDTLGFCKVSQYFC